MMAVTSAAAAAEARDAVGLIQGHAYTILNARRVVTEDGVEHKLIQIRNPWGRIEWQGDWSDRSSLWTDRLRRELGVKPQDDGVFWISMRDVSPYLSYFYVNHFQPGWKLTSVTKATMWSGGGLQRMGLRMRVYDSAERNVAPDLWLTLRCRSGGQDMPALNFSLLEKSDKDGLFWPLADSKFVLYSKVQLELEVLSLRVVSLVLSHSLAIQRRSHLYFAILSLVSKDSKGLRNLNKSREILRSCNSLISAHFLQARPGDYIAVLRVIPPARVSQPKIVFDTYSERPVGLQLTDFETFWETIWPCLPALVKEYGEAATYGEWGASDIVRFQWQSLSLGLVCLLYENGNSDGMCLIEDTEFRLRNLQRLEGQGRDLALAKNQHEISLRISPDTNYLLVFLQEDPRQGFSLGYSRSFVLSSGDEGGEY